MNQSKNYEEKMSGTPTSKQCPTCKVEMEKGKVQTAGHGLTHAFLEIDVDRLEFPEHVSIYAWVCRKCGHVLLNAEFSD
jgi:uncharacterized OB-fold protein